MFLTFLAVNHCNVGDVATVFPSSATPAQRKSGKTKRVEVRLVLFISAAMMSCESRFSNFCY